MNELNILILNAGRRVELTQCFQKAAHRLGIKSSVVAADCSDLAPALYFADKIAKLPTIADVNYIGSIIETCCKYNISLVIPTIDTDLLLLAENKQYIEQKTNAKVLISDPNIIKICRDKIHTHQFLSNHNFGVPRMYTKEDIKNNNLQYPLFIKPKSGSSSINAFKVNDYLELQLYQKVIRDPIVLEFLKGEEYTVDVFLDFESNVITIVPRLRISIRGGEISKGKIVKDRKIIDDVRRLMKELKPIGQITVQLIKTTEDIIKYIEINPRFGGGAPMSINSGADSCEFLYRLLLGEKLTYNENYRGNIYFLRYDSSICLNENMEKV